VPSIRAHLPAPDPGRLLSVTALPGTRSGRVVVEVVGAVDTCTAAALEVCLHSQATQRGLRELVVDLERVSFLGAAGVTVLARAQRRCRMRGARLVVRSGGCRIVLRTLQLTAFADVATIDPPELEPDRTATPPTVPHPRPRPRRTPTRRPWTVCR
jgi:anti-anti-sigma factor